MALYHNFGVFPAAKGLQSRRSQTFTWQMQVSKWCVGELWICEFEQSDEMATLYRWQASSTYFNGLFVAQQMDRYFPKTPFLRPSNFWLVSFHGPLFRVDRSLMVRILAHRFLYRTCSTLPTDEVKRSTVKSIFGEVWWGIKIGASKSQEFCTWME